MKDQIAVATQWGKEPISVQRSEEGKTDNRATEIYDAVARRAYELYETDGRQSGHELEHWLKAEAELLHQSHCRITEKEDAFTVCAEVPGFSGKDLARSAPRTTTVRDLRKKKDE